MKSSVGQGRRGFLKAALLACGTAAVVGPRELFAKSKPRPNILWITFEDASTRMGCYGDKFAHTPVADKLAAEGTRYTHAFGTAGVCAPNRSCIITGMYQSSIGTHHMRNHGQLPKSFHLYPEYLRKAGYYCTNNAKQDYQMTTPESTWNESSSKAHWRNRPDKNQPFFHIRNFLETHEGKAGSASASAEVTANLPQSSRVDPAKLDLPPYYPDTPMVREVMARIYDNIAAMDMLADELLKELEAEGVADDTIVVYYSDHGDGIPRAKRWLYDSGTHVPLIVRIPEKYRVGDQGKPGSVTDELVSFVDLAPTALNLAGIPIPKNMQGRAFLGESLTEKRDYVYGARDRMDERYDIIRMVRDKRYKYIRNYEPFKTYYQYMNTPEHTDMMMEIRRAHANGTLPKEALYLMEPTKPTEELYDCWEDKWELKNLADAPKHHATLKRMRKAHLDWMREIRDVGLVPEAELVNLTAKMGSAYAIPRQPGNEDLIDRALDAALLPEKGAAGIPDILEALSDKDAMVRYWAMISLGNLDEKALPARVSAEKLLGDPSANVRIAVARALCNMKQPQEALPVLCAELKNPNEWARLAAAIVLDSIGNMARLTIPNLEGVMKDKNKYVVRVANHALNILRGTNNRVK